MAVINRAWERGAARLSGRRAAAGKDRAQKDHRKRQQQQEKENR